MLMEVDALCGGYGKEEVVKDVSFSLRDGEFLGIIGPNGSGKTTLVRLLSRVLAPRKGRVLFAGKDVGVIPLKDFCRQVAFVGQELSAQFPFTVWDIVLMGRIPYLSYLQQETPYDCAVAEEALRETDTLHLRDKRIDCLSAGERQRVLIAKALAQQGQLLFLDEPTSHLDIGYQLQILTLLRQLNRSKRLTIVMIIHDLNLAAEYCSRLLLLSKGNIFAQGTPQEVLTYQNVESVYKTVVLVHKNPLSNKPFIVAVPKEHIRG